MKFILGLEEITVWDDGGLCLEAFVNFPIRAPRLSIEVLTLSFRTQLIGET